MMTIDFEKQFEGIQNDRRGVVNSSVYPGIKDLVSEIYPEEAHFIYELLQNAEDAKASKVSFEVKDNMLIFRHNGTKLFDTNDIDSITNIGKSTKKEDYVQAGKFGIGFKSVYAFTDTPSIYCDTICFRIEQLLLPVQIPDLKDREPGWTEFHFPYDSPKIKPNDAREKICRGLTEIENTTLLFLNNICEIDYCMDGKTKYTVTKTGKKRVVICILMENGEAIHEERWLRFSRDCIINDKNAQVDVAFPLTYSEKEEKHDFSIGEDKVCIKFLAKNEKSNLRFFINAPFGCTPSRDSVNKGDANNALLVKEIADLLIDSVKEMRRTGWLTDDFFEILPLEDDRIPEFYWPIVEAAKKSFIDYDNLPTTDGSFVLAENGVLSSRNVIDKVLAIEDVRELYQNKNLCFVKNKPVNMRASQFLKSLGIKELTPEDLLVQMTKVGNTVLLQWIKGIPDYRIQEFYVFSRKGLQKKEQDFEEYRGFIYYVNLFYASEEQRHKGKIGLRLEDELNGIKALPIVKTSNGDFVSASDTYLTEKDVEVPEEFVTVCEDVCKSEKAREFLLDLGAQTFSKEELREYIRQSDVGKMEEYLNKIGSSDATGEFDPLAVARRILTFLKSHQQDEIYWNDYGIVYAQCNEGEGFVYRSPCMCCLDAPLIDETGFATATRVHKKYVVDGIYKNLSDMEFRAWIKFLINNHALYKIEVEQDDTYTYYSTGIHIDFYIDNLNSYLALRSIPLSRYIWKTLSTRGNWNEKYCEKIHRKNRNYSTTYCDSTVLKHLKEIKWVPDRDGTFHTPQDVSRTTIDESFVIDGSNGFLEAIQFGKNEKDREQAERERLEKQYLEQAQQKEAAQKLGFENTDAVIRAKEDSKTLQALREAGFNPEEFFESIRGKNKSRMDLDSMLNDRQDEPFVDNGNDEGVIPVVPNPSRRESKMREHLSSGPTEKRRRIHIKETGQSNQEERVFLNNQYGGRCQVCDEIIVKRDGSHYFEAINLLSTSKIMEEYLTGLEIGWNSLCLCPNCAAKFVHGAVSLYNFKDDVIATSISREVEEHIEYPIRMQGKECKIKYTPVHLFNLQIALKYFSEMKCDIEQAADASTETDFENDTSDSGIEAQSLEVSSITRCGKCGAYGVYDSGLCWNCYNAEAGPTSD